MFVINSLRLDELNEMKKKLTMVIIIFLLIFFCLYTEYIGLIGPIGRKLFIPLSQKSYIWQNNVCWVS